MWVFSYKKEKLSTWKYHLNVLHPFAMLYFTLVFIFGHNLISHWISCRLDPPVCQSEGRIIRAALKQTLNITCDIDSNPLVSQKDINWISFQFPNININTFIFILIEKLKVQVDIQQYNRQFNRIAIIYKWCWYQLQ